MSKIEDKVSVTPKILLQGGEVKFTEENGFQEYNTEYGWLAIPVIDVPLDDLLMTYEDLVNELGDKQVELAHVKEEYNREEFEIVYKSDIDFKSLYGSTSEKVRKQHAKDVLSELYDKKESLELSISFIEHYLPLIRECIRAKQP